MTELNTWGDVKEEDSEKSETEPRIPVKNII